jgi:hypothetical protein
MSVVSTIAILLLTSVVVALPVEHDAPSGVAAISVERVTGSRWLEPKEHTVYYVLTTDGRVRVQVWKDVKEEGEDWKSADIDWPVPFATIVDWTPSPMYPAVDEIELAAGIIVTAEGAIWRAVPSFEKTWDAGSVMKGIRWEQVRSD